MHTSPSRCCQGLICYGLHIDTVFCAHLSTGRAELSASLPEDASAYWVPAAQGHRQASTSDDPFADGDADGGRGRFSWSGQRTDQCLSHRCPLASKGTHLGERHTSTKLSSLAACKCCVCRRPARLEHLFVIVGLCCNAGSLQEACFLAMTRMSGSGSSGSVGASRVAITNCDLRAEIHICRPLMRTQKQRRAPWISACRSCRQQRSHGAKAPPVCARCLLGSSQRG